MRNNVGVIGDLHLPFERPDYLNFCVEIFDRCKVKTVIQIGDLVDFHAISFHEHNPNGRSASDEMADVDKRLKRWFGAFPSLYLCLGNHDKLPARQAVAHGLPDRLMRTFREVWQFPDTWHENYSWEFDGVIYTHGTGLSGKYAHIKAAEGNRQSTVIGHTHSSGGQITYLVSENDRIFGMNVGCGIDRKRYAFEYGVDQIRKPVLGCGVVTDKGRYCQWFPMSL